MKMQGRSIGYLVGYLTILFHYRVGSFIVCMLNREPAKFTCVGVMVKDLDPSLRHRTRKCQLLSVSDLKHEGF